MPYASTDDLIAAAGGPSSLAQLVEREAPDDWTGTPREYWIAKAQRWGDALVNRYLPPRYRTPLTGENPSIEMLAAAEGIYQLRVVAGTAGDDDKDAAEERRGQLKDMRDGKQWPTNLPSKGTRGRKSVFVSNQGKMTRKKLDGLI